MMLPRSEHFTPPAIVFRLRTARSKSVLLRNRSTDTRALEEEESPLNHRFVRLRCIWATPWRGYCIKIGRLPPLWQGWTCHLKAVGDCFCIGSYTVRWRTNLSTRLII